MLTGWLPGHPPPRALTVIYITQGPSAAVITVLEPGAGDHTPVPELLVAATRDFLLR